MIGARRLALVLLLWAAASHSGVYLRNMIPDSVWGNITHPTVFSGAGGELSIGICLDGDPANDPLLAPLQRAMATWNALTPTTQNFLFDGGDPDRADAEFTLVHELGHCAMGLDHFNLEDEARVPPLASDFFTNAIGSIFNPSEDFMCGPCEGTDTWAGSPDDLHFPQPGNVAGLPPVRNLHWFRIAVMAPRNASARIQQATARPPATSASELTPSTTIRV